MEQYGLVMQSSGRLAEVSIRQHSACAKCGKCDLSHESKELQVSALNQAGAVPGDMVCLEMPHRDLVSAGMIAYGLPLLSLFAGALIGQAIFDQLGAAILGFLGLALTYAFIHWRLEPRMKNSQRYQITITRVINEEVFDYGTEHEDSNDK